MVASLAPADKPATRALRQPETLRAAYLDLAGASPLTTVAIARRANIDPSVIYKWRMGVRTSADRPVIEAVATALGLCDRDRSRLLAAGGYMPWIWSPFLAQAAALEALYEMGGDAPRPAPEPPTTAQLPLDGDNAGNYAPATVTPAVAPSSGPRLFRGPVD